jgi:hypothetical protein
MSSNNKNTNAQQPEQIRTEDFIKKQYIERTLDENGNPKYKLCNYGFVPTNVNDPRYDPMKGFNQKIVNLLTSLSEDNEES